MTALLIVLTFAARAPERVLRDRRVRDGALAPRPSCRSGRRRARAGLASRSGSIDEIGDYISACQVGITMASIGIGALGQPVIAHALEPLFGEPRQRRRRGRIAR